MDMMDVQLDVLVQTQTLKKVQCFIVLCTGRSSFRGPCFGSMTL